VKEDSLHETYIKRCLELALSGLGNTAPNPLVGSVIVHNGRIIGEGYHKQFGGPHAEVNAVLNVKEKALLPLSTLYVNLEPCSHTGKTPPCADMIIQAGIRDVVIGTVDPNPIVSGNGIKKLERAGVRVIHNILPRECQYVNRRFFTYHIQKRPYILLKWAQTADGFIDIIRDDGTSEPAWISNDISRMIVHKWRAEEQSILVGTNTALIDNPRLNVREWPGKSPLRMVIDRSLRLPAHLHLFDNTYNTLVFNEKIDRHALQTTWVRLDFGASMLPQLLANLYAQNIQSMMVEGGRKLICGFLDADLWDEARVFVGSKKFGNGLPAPLITTIEPRRTAIRKDTLLVYLNQA